MFVHLLSGSLTFLLFGKVFNFEVARIYLLLGSFCGLVPDIISHILSPKVKFNKWYHTHRDNFSHSIFFPTIVLLVAFILNSNFGIMIAVTILTHPFLDLFGIGWGVKLFYPFSNNIYKMFYRGMVLTVWNQREVDAEVEKFGDNNWVRNIYFKPNFVGVSEWLSLIGFLLLVIAN
ncbi:MAG: metal-dependent hydrolase [bacterium]